jgi:hypothetical protein
VVDGNPDCTVRVHRTLLTRALADGELRQKFAPLLASVLANRIDAMSDTVDLKAANLSMDGEWLAFDYSPAGGEEPSSRVALDAAVKRQLK